MAEAVRGRAVHDRTGPRRAGLPLTSRHPGESRDPLLGRLGHHDPIRSITASSERPSEWMGLSTGPRLSPG